MHGLQRLGIRHCNILDLHSRMDREPAAHDALQRGRVRASPLANASAAARERPAQPQRLRPVRAARGRRSGCSGPGRRRSRTVRHHLDHRAASRGRAPSAGSAPPAGRPSARTTRTPAPHRWKSLATMVSTPAKWPGRNSPSQRVADPAGHHPHLGARGVHRLDGRHEERVHAARSRPARGRAAGRAGSALRSSFGPNCGGLTKMLITTTSLPARAASTSARCPSCREPMVGTRPMRRPRAWSRAPRP